MVILPDPQDEKTIMVQKFNTLDSKDAEGAQEATAAIFESETGSTIIND